LADKTPAADGKKTNGPPPVSLAVESNHLLGWALAVQRHSAAADALKVAAKDPASPSADHARAWLGKIAFDDGKFSEAIQWWQAVEAKKRALWKLGEPLGGSVFLTALEAFQDERFEQAADKLREAGKAGWRDRRLGSLLTLALVKAGQQKLHQPA
jgi:Flp pilus assembly protein TadD